MHAENAFRGTVVDVETDVLEVHTVTRGIIVADSSIEDSLHRRFPTPDVWFA
jgi:hypothetical protein